MSVFQRWGPSKEEPRRAAVIIGSLVLTLTMSASARAAEINYKIQPLIKVGDTVGGVRLTSPFSLSALNDHGQLAFVIGASSGGLARFSGTDGQIVPLVTRGGAGPDGPWPKTPGFNPLTSINQDGDIAISLEGPGAYLWSAATQQHTVVATVGMPALDRLTFSTGALNSPSLNNRSEVGLGMPVKDATEKTQQVCFCGRRTESCCRWRCQGTPCPTAARSTRPVGSARSTMRESPDFWPRGWEVRHLAPISGSKAASPPWL